jgi:hypothetical protein
MIAVTAPSTDARTLGFTSNYYLPYSHDHRIRSDRPYSAHRLWMKLWTSLGRAADNSGQPGGNAGVSGAQHLGVHSAATARTRATAPAVDEKCRADLAGPRMSPGSTDPMTTTFLYLADNPRTKQAGRGSRSERPAALPGSCRPDRRSGGGVR